MLNRSNTRKQATKASDEPEKSGFNLQISTEAQVAISKGLIMTLIVVVMGFLAYYKINEPVVWSSIMTISGYVAFANPKASSSGETKK